MFADKMKAFDNVKQIFIEVMEKNIAFLQSSPVDLFDVVKEYINTIRKIDTIEIEKVKTVLQLQNLLEDIGKALAYSTDNVFVTNVRNKILTEDDYICTSMFSTLTKHFIYAERLKHSVGTTYKNIAYVWFYHLGATYCYLNDKTVLSELIQIAIYLYLLRPSVYEINHFEEEIHKTCAAINRLKDSCDYVAFTIEQDFLVLDEKTLFFIQAEMEKDIRIIGGKKFLEILLSDKIKPYYDKRLGRYRIHRYKNITSKGFDKTPVKYLVLIALRTLKYEMPLNLDTRFVRQRYERIVNISQDLLLVLELASDTMFEDINVDNSNINTYICNNMLYDKLVIPVQYNVDFLLSVIEILFYPFKSQFSSKGYSLKNYVRFVKAVLKSNKHNFTFDQLRKITGVADEALKGILEDVAIDAQKVNLGFTSILQPSNSDDYAFIKESDDTYYFFDARISGLGFYRVLYNQTERVLGTKRALNTKLGLQLEKYVKDYFSKIKYTYLCGKYSLGKGLTDECDVILNNEEIICGIELKHTLLDKCFDNTDDVALYATLGMGMIKAQRQLLKHRIDLLQQGGLKLATDDGKVTSLTRTDERIFSVSLCLSEYRFLTNKLVSEKILTSVATCKISLADTTRQAELNTFYEEQQKIQALLNKAYQAGTFGCKGFHPFGNSLFMSLQQLYLACKLCKNKDVFLEFINNQLRVITGAMDFYEELLTFLEGLEIKKKKKVKV